ncbi:hypothetical protein WN55_07505 [Dufourea novaeangliae]|uniref:Uncharacterized protein n=1 Tax=Dufourea novaeangliae TaxID=178035 RepID=A0A154PS61_DUFNO|nr:hypothetical protein WN55_07505 [Dufourea novaeangliae]
MYVCVCGCVCVDTTKVVGLSARLAGESRAKGRCKHSLIGAGENSTIRVHSTRR